MAYKRSLLKYPKKKYKLYYSPVDGDELYCVTDQPTELKLQSRGYRAADLDAVVDNIWRRKEVLGYGNMRDFVFFLQEFDIYYTPKQMYAILSPTDRTLRHRLTDPTTFKNLARAFRTTPLQLIKKTEK